MDMLSNLNSNQQWIFNYKQTVRILQVLLRDHDIHLPRYVQTHININYAILV